MKRTTKKAVPTDIDAYLDALPSAQRTALQSLRQTILKAAPGVEESISYGLPTFRINGKPLIYFGAAKSHCSLYGAPDASLADELAEWDTSGKGTVRFTPDHPLPARLVRKIVALRLTKLAAKRGEKLRRS